MFFFSGHFALWRPGGRSRGGARQQDRRSGRRQWRGGGEMFPAARSSHGKGELIPDCQFTVFRAFHRTHAQTRIGRPAFSRVAWKQHNTSFVVADLFDGGRVAGETPSGGFLVQRAEASGLRPSLLLAVQLRQVEENKATNRRISHCTGFFGCGWKRWVTMPPPLCADTRQGGPSPIPSKLPQGHEADKRSCFSGQVNSPRSLPFVGLIHLWRVCLLHS